MRFVFCALVASLLAETAVGAQTYVVRRVAPDSANGYGEVHVDKAAIAGQEVRVWWAMALNPDCTKGATMQTDIVQPPRHGSVRLSDDSFYPNFPAPNPRAACDTKPKPGKQAFYTPQSGFHGHDKIVLQNATSEGRIRKVSIDIDVR